MKLLNKFISQRLQPRFSLIISDYFPSPNRYRYNIQREVFQVLMKDCSPSQGLLKKDFWIVLSQNVIFIWTLIVTILLIVLLFCSSIPKIMSLIGGVIMLFYLSFIVELELENYIFNQWLDLIIKARKNDNWLTL